MSFLEIPFLRTQQSLFLSPAIQSVNQAGAMILVLSLVEEVDLETLGNSPQVTWR